VEVPEVRPRADAEAEVSARRKARNAARTQATIRIEKQTIMTIPATYENGVFKPLENVDLKEGTRVEVHVPADAPKRRKSVREFAAFGMWADCDDIPDGVTYEDRIRQPRY
jgi:predicted DNA-binding antitoxin AbrB/MazE fold protein